MVKKMSDEKVKKITHNLIPRPGYIFLQLIMFVLVYGFDMEMPWWAMWFPSLIMGGIIVVICIVLVIVLAIALYEK